MSEIHTNGHTNPADLQRLYELQVLHGRAAVRERDDLRAENERLRAELDRLQRRAGQPARPRSLKDLELITGADLLNMDLPEPSYIVPPILPEGLSLLVAPAKTGKSLIALNVALALATGGKAFGSIPVEPGGVLYLDLDASKRGQRSRLRTLLAGSDRSPERLRFAFRTFTTMEQGGLDDLRGVIEAYRHPDPIRLVIIDTWQRFRPKTRAGVNLYESDYDALAPLRSLCEDTGVSMLVLHHSNQGRHEDPLRSVSGSEGIVAAVDNILLLQRKRGAPDATLTVTAREEEDAEYALRFDPEVLTWTLRGRSDEMAATDERQRILDVLREVGEPMTPREIAEELEVPEANVKKLVRKMLEAGTLYQEHVRGPYSIPGHHGHHGHQD